MGLPPQQLCLRGKGGKSYGPPWCEGVALRELRGLFKGSDPRHANAWKVHIIPATSTSGTLEPMATRSGKTNKLHDSEYYIYGPGLQAPPPTPPQRVWVHRFLYVGGTSGLPPAPPCGLGGRVWMYIEPGTRDHMVQGCRPHPPPPPKGLGAQVFVCRGDKWSSPAPPLWVGGACLDVHACMDVCMYLYVSMYVCMYSMPRPPVGGWGVSVCTCMYWCMYVFVCKYVCVYV